MRVKLGKGLGKQKNILYIKLIIYNGNDISVMSVPVIDVPTKDLLASQTKGAFVLISSWPQFNVCKQISSL